MMIVKNYELSANSSKLYFNELILTSNAMKIIFVAVELRIWLAVCQLS